jgi:dTDP-4-amino-4,6-dideoxygalactose transaminase
MIRKVPVVATPISASDLAAAFKSWTGRADSGKELSRALAEYIHTQRVFLFNSGTSSAYVILNALKRRSGRSEVILPAYTASALLIAVRKAQLTPVLCDISLEDFNLDEHSLRAAVTPNTLCIFGVHMFGIVSSALWGAKQAFPSVFVIEDCAQAFGSRVEGRSVGNLADASIFSFNRGKNLTTYGGGCLATSRAELIELFEEALRNAPELNRAARFLLPLKLTALSLVMRPYFYGVLSCIVSRFREQPPRQDFDVRGYAPCQAAAALSLLARIDTYSEERYRNGIRLREGLKDIDGIMVPRILENTAPAFNRFPLLIKDLKRRDAVKQGLIRAGIDTSYMYLRPLHRIFKTQYKETDFPNAGYFAEHLLTLPAHPYVSEKDIARMIEVIRCSL